MGTRGDGRRAATSAESSTAPQRAFEGPSEATCFGPAEYLAMANLSVLTGSVRELSMRRSTRAA